MKQEKKEKRANKVIELPRLKHLTVWELGEPYRACTHLVTGPKDFNGGKRLREGFRSLDLAITWALNREAEVLKVGQNLSMLDGKVRQESVDCIAEMEKHGVKLSVLEAVRIAIAQEEKKARGIPLGQYIASVRQRLREGKHRPITMRVDARYSHYLARLVGWIGAETNLALIEKVQIIKGLEKLKLGPASYNHHLKFYKYLFSLAVDDDYLDKNPLAKAKSRTEPPTADVDPLTPRQVRAFLYAAWEFYPELVPYFVLAFYGCLRAFGEMIRIGWQEIDLDDLEILLPRGKSKVFQARYIDIRHCLANWLSAWKCAFPAQAVGPILAGCYASMSYKRAVLAQIIGLEGWMPNIARKTNISYMERLSNEEQAAKQHGTSRRKVNTNYLQPVRRSAARQYVSVVPPDYPPGQGRTWMVPEFCGLAMGPSTSPPKPEPIAQ